MAESTIIPVSVAIDSYSDPVIYRNLIVNTVIGGHHHFSFTWNVGSIKNDQDFQLSIIRDYIGKIATIKFDQNEFIGIITSISVEDINSATQTFTVSGQSLSIMIDQIPECATYFQKDLSKIIDGTLEGVPGNVLKKDISPNDTTAHHYVTQYNETDFQFLQRLSTRYGEWFYVDGQTLVFGKPGDSGAVLKSGSDLKNFVLQGNLQPSKFSFTTYDSFKGQPVEKKMASPNSVGHDIADAVISASKDLHTRETGRKMHNFNAVNKAMIDAVANVQQQLKEVQSLTVSGESKHPAMKAGNKFKIETQSGKYEYIATSVVHYSSQIGHYENNFQAVVGSSKVPPYANPNIFRRADVQSAIVKENHDQDGLNRIKVNFPWQKSSDMTPWIRVATPHAGSEKGWHFIPEKDEEVIIDFEGGDVDKPFMVAAHFHGGAKSKISDQDNNIKALKTKSGNTITLNDKEGSITITDPKGSIIILKGDDTIEIKSKKKISVQSEEIEFKADKDINMTAGGKINVKAKQDITVESEQKITQKATMDFKVEGMKIDMAAQMDFKVHGLKVEIKADTQLQAEGSVQASLKGGAQLELSGGAMATLKGGMVMIN